jgi:hypothetical protein
MIFQLDKEAAALGTGRKLTLQHDEHPNSKPWLTNTTKSGDTATQPIYRFKTGLNFTNTPNPTMDDVVQITAQDTFRAGEQAPFVIGVKGAVWGGSKDDVLTHGKSARGVWTVEFSRKLDTGYDDDIKLVPGQPATFVVIVRDDNKGYGESVPVTLIP